jgi:hypothetical protein
MMRLATCCLAGQRREWALAMEAEFDAAFQDGRAWPFSVGCLIASWRELPTHVEGRLLLARYGIALGVIIPMAALLLSAALLRLPEIGSVAATIDPGQAGLINDGNRAAVPVLSQLIVAIGALRLGSAWAMLDRNWTRVAALERLSAAATITLAVLGGLATLDAACAILPATALLVEVLVLSRLARLHDRTALGCDA